MSKNVETSTLNLRYEGYRLKDAASEARLMATIAERGIDKPLEGVDTPEGRYLLNGFKRYRCAQKLGIHCVPYVSLGAEEASAIVALMRLSSSRPLGILEQAKFVVELLTIHGMSIADVAESLSRSKAWVCMRRKLLEEMSEAIEEILFRGAFPVYCYMHTLRPFRRMNSKKELDKFVELLAGKRLSVRDVDLLAHGYFRGPDSLRSAICDGKLNWSLDQMKKVPQDPEGCNDFERGLLKDLQTLKKYMQRVMLKCDNDLLTSRPFYAQANLLAAGLLGEFNPFQERMKAFHDRSGNK